MSQTLTGILSDYMLGRLDMGITLLITVAIVCAAWVIIDVLKRRYRKKHPRKIENKLVTVDPDIVMDTPYIDSSSALAQGPLYKYWFERGRDWLIRTFKYKHLTVVRLNTEGNASHREYVLDPAQMLTVNWDNCTYNVRRNGLVPIRGANLMVVIEGISEPLDLWNWADIMKLIEKTYQKKLDETKLDEDLKLKIGKFTFNAQEFYSKMNNRNIEKLAMTSIPNMQLLFYASIAAAGFGLMNLLMLWGIIPSGIDGSIADLKLGIIEVLKYVKK